MRDVPVGSSSQDTDSTLLSAQTSLINKQGWYRVIFNDSYTAVPRRQLLFGDWHGRNGVE